MGINGDGTGVPIDFSKLTGYEYLEDYLVAHYHFDNSSTENMLSGKEAKFIKQAFDQDESGQLSFNADVEPDPIELNAEYTNKGTANHGDYALNLTKTSKLGGVLLDAVPDNTFTVSMAIYRANTTASANDANLMYIGDLDTTKDPNYRIRYHGTNTSGTNNRHLRFDEQKNGTVSAKAGAANIFNNFTTSGWQVATFVVDGTSVTAYNNGAKSSGTGDNPGTITGFSKEDAVNIILAGLTDQYGGGAADICIDDLYIFDNALEPEAVNNLVNVLMKNNCGANLDSPDIGSLDGWKPVYEGDIVIGAMSSGQFSNSSQSERKGWYYVNSHSEWGPLNNFGIATGKQLVSIDRSNERPLERRINIPKAYTNDTKGTYNHIIGLCDRLNDAGVTNAFKKNKNANEMMVVQDGPDDDPTYYLVSTFWTGSDSDKMNHCSLVYHKPDAERTKIETLQYSLNAFTAKLYDESPQSRVSAVRFSLNPNNAYKGDGYFNAGSATDAPANEKTDLNKLVLLDWNKDGRGGIVSERRTSRGSEVVVGTADSTQDGYNLDSYLKPELSKIDRYNYFLTGGTYTWTGLKAFYTQLQTRDTRYDSYGIEVDGADKARKYLIVFTDGRDNEVSAISGNGEDVNDIQVKTKDANRNDVTYKGKTGTNSLAKAPAKIWADNLKKAGYTIYCVMLASGSVSKNNNPKEYHTAKTFLANLIAGPKFEEFGSYEGKIEDFGGDDNRAGHTYVYTPETDAELSSTFDYILDVINSELEDYTIQDYIDPRFDLIDRNGRTYYLKANGEIKAVEKDGETLASYSVHNDDIQIADRNSEDGIITLGDNEYCTYRTMDRRHARLYYDKTTDMYYLKWVDETISGCAEGANMVEIWKTKIRIKAKDDFIGGNEILTNGNLADMNYVFDPTDDLANSGTTRASIKLTDKVDGSDAFIGVPSKGFPRTVVNVRLLPMHGNATLADKIYMGEAISPAQLLIDIEGKYNSNIDTNSYYLEYLKRYAYQRYLKYLDEYNGSMPDPDQEKQMNMTLIDLLNEWLAISGSETSESFSIPYMYLPSPEYNPKDGTIVTDENSYEAAHIYNNTGLKDYNEKDVVGILTYRWEQLDKEGNAVAVNTEREYVTNNTEQVKYALTVEYTPLKAGDEIATFRGVKLDGNGLDFNETGLDSNFFASYLGIDGSNTGKITGSQEELAYYFDRLASVNGTPDSAPLDYMQPEYLADGLIDETQSTVPAIQKPNMVLNAQVYRWNPEYKPTVGEEQLECEEISNRTQEQITNKITHQTKAGVNYGDAKIINRDRTLMTDSDYIIDIISGGLALELEVPKKELESALDENHEFKGIFTATAIRSFTDTDYIEEKKGSTIKEDFGNTFDLTFTFNYSAKEIEALLDEADKSSDYIKLFARATKIEGDWKNEDGTSVKKSWKELPIGTYTINIDSIKQYAAEDTSLTNELVYGKDGYIPFTIFTTEKNNADEFKGTYPVITETGDLNSLLFNHYILNGFGTTNELDGSLPEGFTPEITANNIADFIAQHIPEEPESAQTLTFYLGTGTDDHRGDITTDEDYKYDKYLKDRLGVILLSLGNVDLELSKKVENTLIQEYLDIPWKFDITLKSSSPLNELTFPTAYVDSDGKIIEGSDGEISFTIKQNSSYEYTATVFLKHNQKLIIKSLPDDIDVNYEIQETGSYTDVLPDDVGYESTFDQKHDSNTGKLIKSGGTTEVLCINTFYGIDMPELGGSGMDYSLSAYGYCLVIASMLVFGYMIIFRRRKKRISN